MQSNCIVCECGCPAGNQDTQGGSVGVWVDQNWIDCHTVTLKLSPFLFFFNFVCVCVFFKACLCARNCQLYTAREHCGLGSRSNHGLVSCLPHLLHAYLHIVLMSSCLCPGLLRPSTSDKEMTNSQNTISFFPPATQRVWHSAIVHANDPLVLPSVALLTIITGHRSQI